VLALDGGSLATSGDYRFFRDLEGRRISHIIDPRTGHPVEHTLASVTIYDDSSCTRADGFATALLVLGPEEAFELAEELGLASLFLLRNDDGKIEEWVTERFEKLLTATAQRLH
jgi:thiamine biosynthesis lipoprotein